MMRIDNGGMAYTDAACLVAYWCGRLGCSPDDKELALKIVSQMYRKGRLIHGRKS